MDDAVPMIRRRIDRIQLHRNGAGVDNVVIRSGWYEHREAGLDRRANAVEHRLPRSFLYAKKLVEMMHFRTNLLLGLQRHDDELAVLRRVKHLAEQLIPDRDTLDVLYVAFHSETSFRVLSWLAQTFASYYESNCDGHPPPSSPRLGIRGRLFGALALGCRIPHFYIGG